MAAIVTKPAVLYEIKLGGIAIQTFCIVTKEPCMLNFIVYTSTAHHDGKYSVTLYMHRLCVVLLGFIV